MTYPFGLYEGEPGTTEIHQRKVFLDTYGPNHLAIRKTCPACDNPNAEWIRQRWAICFDCELAFDSLELYIEPIPDWLEYIEGGDEDG